MLHWMFDYPVWIVLAGAIGAAIGATWEAMSAPGVGFDASRDPFTIQKRPAAVAGVFGWGALLAAFLFQLGALLSLHAKCEIDMPTQHSDPTAFELCESVDIWFILVTQWQTGIGATIGLLGVAWSTFYNSIRGKS
ncbi:MAG: hypothetical protein AAF665_16560 [Pseudomonadota bacterium]